MSLTNAVGYVLTALGGVLLCALDAPLLASVLGGSAIALGGFFCGWAARERE